MAALAAAEATSRRYRTILHPYLAKQYDNGLISADTALFRSPYRTVTARCTLSCHIHPDWPMFLDKPGTIGSALRRFFGSVNRGKSPLTLFLINPAFAPRAAWRSKERRQR